VNIVRVTNNTFPVIQRLYVHTHGFGIRPLCVAGQLKNVKHVRGKIFANIVPSIRVPETARSNRLLQ
jgi:hypothetical protein